MAHAAPRPDGADTRYWAVQPPSTRRAAPTEVPRRSAHRGLVRVGQGDGGAGGGERPGRGRAHAGVGPGDEGDASGEVVGGVHGCSGGGRRGGRLRA